MVSLQHGVTLAALSIPPGRRTEAINTDSRFTLPPKAWVLGSPEQPVPRLEKAHNQTDRFMLQVPRATTPPPGHNRPLPKIPTRKQR